MENKLGHYKILRQIGKGGMGIIYKALNPATQKTVAIKVLPPMMVDRVTVERFHREVQAMVQLKHPNMIEVYDSGMQDGKHFLVMEFLEGENLKNLIKAKGPLSIDRALEVSIRIADALRHMHQLGMIHRDIKPANIMIMPDGRIKLMDYGLVKILGRTSVTMEGSSLGTAEYMSPEQIAGDPVDIRTDIYSLGISMYEMLTGSLPFTGETLQEFLHKHQTQTGVSVRQLRPEISLEFEMIINKAMAKELKSRYFSAEELKKDLEKLTYSMQGQTHASMRDIKSVVQGATQNDNVPKPISASCNKRVDKKSSKTFQLPLGKLFVFVFFVIAGVIYHDKVLSVLKRISWNKFCFWAEQKDLVKETNSSLVLLEQAEAHFNQGQAYIKQGLLDKAQEALTAALQLRGDQPMYLKELAIVYEMKNDYKKAVNAWKDLLKYETDSAQIKMAQEHIKKLSKYLK